MVKSTRTRLPRLKSYLSQTKNFAIGQIIHEMHFIIYKIGLMINRLIWTKHWAQYLVYNKKINVNYHLQVFNTGFLCAFTFCPSHPSSRSLKKGIMSLPSDWSIPRVHLLFSQTPCPGFCDQYGELGTWPSVLTNTNTYWKFLYLPTS